MLKMLKDVAPGKYLDDIEYGLIYREDKQEAASKYRTQKQRFLFKAVGNYMRTREDEGMCRVVVVHPNGRGCEGTCKICFGGPRETKVLTADRIKQAIGDIKNGGHLTDGPLRVLYMGGEPMLHPDIGMVTRQIIESLGRPAEYEFISSLLVSEEKYENYKRTIDETAANPAVDSVRLLISADLGTTSRHSKRVSNVEQRRRTAEIVDMYEDHPKVHLRIGNVMSQEFDIDLFFEDVDKYIDRNVVISLQPHPHKNNNIHESDDYNRWMAAIQERYNMVFRHGDCAILRSKDHDVCTMKHDVFLLELEDGVYCINPMKRACCAKLSSIGFDENSYFGCTFGDDEGSTTPEESISVKTSPELTKRFQTLPQHCRTCDLVAVCDVCAHTAFEGACLTANSPAKWMRDRWKILVRMFNS